MDVLQGKVVPVKLWAPIHEVESQALDQLKNIAALPWAFHHVAVMPDVHYGKGATVGSVIAMKDAVSPAAVGVDIGCGMAAVKTSLTAAQLPDTLSALRAEIEAAIPVGFNSHPDAYLNRSVMLSRLMVMMSAEFHDLMVNFEPPIQCHHNYVSEETHFGEDVLVTRKGAISARDGEYGIIPGSMGTSSFIVRGLGNPESFCSASHGAGRTMSRGQAKRSFTIEDLATQTRGVECRKDAGVLDEIPGAYKPIHEVMAHQADLVEVVAELKQILCVKG